MADLVLLHCADLHLNSPFLGLSKIDTEAAQQLREATFSSFRRLVDHAIDRGVDLFTVAGDVFDSSDHGLHTAVVFRDQLRRLSAAKIPCAVVAGNHDPLTSWRLATRLPEGCHLFADTPERWPVRRGDRTLAHVYGVSFARTAVRDNLARHLAALHRPDPGLHLALMHGNVGGAEGHENYAPCALDDLAQAPFDAWLLGHVHERRTLSDADPLVVYPGNSQGRSIREPGERGGLLIRFSEAGSPEVTFVPTAEAVWMRGETSIEGLTGLEELVERLDDDLDALVADQPETGAFVVRWRLVGRGALHGELTAGLDELLDTVRERRQSASPPLYIERLESRTQPLLDLEELRQQKGFVSMVLACADELDAEGANEALQQRFAELWDKPNLRRPLSGLRRRFERDPEQLQRLVRRAALLAVGTLSEGRGK